MQPNVFSTHAYRVTFYDRRQMPLFTDEIYADNDEEAKRVAFHGWPDDLEFDVLRAEDVKERDRPNYHVPTRQFAAQALRRKALEPNKLKLWARTTHKRQKPTRQHEELVAATLPPKLIFGHFKAEDEGIEAFRVLERHSFVVTEDLTISEILVTAHENIPNLKSGYLAGINPFTGKVMMTLPLE